MENTVLRAIKQILLESLLQNFNIIKYCQYQLAESKNYKLLQQEKEAKSWG